MIVSFRNKDLRLFWEKGNPQFLPPDCVGRIEEILTRLDDATSPHNMNIPGLRLHKLRGHKPPRWSVWVSANYRITFSFDENNNACKVDFEDYH